MTVTGQTKRVAEPAPGVGPVLVLDVGGGGGREELARMDRGGPGAGLGPLGRPAG